MDKNYTITQRFTRPQFLLILSTILLGIITGLFVISSYISTKHTTQTFIDRFGLTDLADLDRKILQLHLETHLFLHGFENDYEQLRLKKDLLTNEIRLTEKEAFQVSPEIGESIQKIGVLLSEYDILLDEVLVNRSHISDDEAQIETIFEQMEQEIAFTQTKESALFFNSVSEALLSQRDTQVMVLFLSGLFAVLNVILAFSLRHTIGYQFQLLYDQQEAELEERRRIERDLVQAKERAEVANQAKNNFLSNMSHELRTPLNGVLGYAQILLRERPLSPSQERGLQTIYQSGHHLLTIINDILYFSMIEGQKMSLQAAPLHLGTFLDGIVAMIQIQMRAEQKELSLIYQKDDNLPIGIKGDEKRLRQALINLLSNGIKFTQIGQVTLNVNQLEADEASSLLRFEVQDTGIGIDEAELEHIFLPFEQIGNRNDRAEGTGLGLAITKRLVSLMGGSLQVESEVGKGSRFWFELRVAVVAASKPSETLQQKMVGYKGECRQILVVDDNLKNRELLFDLLSPLGFEIAEAENGQEALAKAIELQPDLILMDLVMPVMGGLEAVKEMRHTASLRETPIIAVSAKAFAKDQHEARRVRFLRNGTRTDESLAAGCNAFLAKPIDQQKLLALISQQLNIEWIDESLDSSLPEVATAIPFVLPPRQDLEELYKLSTLGMMSQIRKKAKHIEQLDAQYAPFANKIRQLALEFEDEKILKLVEECLERAT